MPTQSVQKYATRSAIGPGPYGRLSAFWLAVITANSGLGGGGGDSGGEGGDCGDGGGGGGGGSGEGGANAPFDFIVAADAIYLATQIEPLLASLDALARPRVEQCPRAVRAPVPGLSTPSARSARAAR